MIRKGRSFDATFLQLYAININSFVEIDTKDGYEYHKIYSYRLDKDGSFIAVFSDAGVLRHVAIAKATGLRRTVPCLFHELDLEKRREVVG